MTFEQFHHRLRILLNLEREDLTGAGAIEPGDDEAAARFRANPFTFFIRAGDASARRIWALIQRLAARTEEPRQ